MAFRFLTVPALSSAEAEREVNAFLASHKILSVDRRWIDLGTSSYWALCIDYLPGNAADPARPPDLGRNRIDYKQVLTPVEFETFARLREWRKAIALKEAIPAYTIFTNEQFAQMVQRCRRTKRDLQAIDGVGEARVEKYADEILPFLIPLPESESATDRKPLSSDPGS